MNGWKSLLLIALAVGGCSGSNDFRTYYFAGRVYDGATGDRLTKYKLDLQYFDQRVSAQVASDGRYFVGPLNAFNDYTIEIVADGYRSFLSHNEMKKGEMPSVTRGESFYYDAYLFPVALQSPAANIEIKLSDSQDLPSGTIRFRATSGSVLDSTSVDSPAGVLNQVWGNDDDVQFRTVTKQFTNGALQLAEGDLVYGVTYAVNIYDVIGHADFNSGTYQSGIDGDASFVVDPVIETPLKVAFKNTDLGVPVPTGDLVILFNQDVELDPTETTNDYIFALDSGLSIPDVDTNGSGNKNSLKPDTSPIVNDRGIKLTVNGATMTIGWGGASALLTSDSGDALTLIYGNLDQVKVRPKGGSAKTTSTLATLLGSATTNVIVTP